MKKIVLLSIQLVCCLAFARAEDGSRLWLRLSGGANAQVTKGKNASGPTIDIAVRELRENWTGRPVVLAIDKTLKSLGDGYRISDDGHKVTVQAAREIGLLYGAYGMLRIQQCGGQIGRATIEEHPAYNIRMLDHWDNPDGTVERGYAGHSLWKWDELPEKLSPRYEQYARANASIGINGAALNNVNAKAEMLSPVYLAKVKALAEVFRPYGIKVYLSAMFSSPKALGGLPDADPLDPAVQKWWSDKAREIYSAIPDFGGFVVKANSEGQPGPQDYGRTHADGANMLADALRPYGGIVMWRAFVYAPTGGDRAKQAYDEFMPLDGKFGDNVILQIKNGPIDFQPREPFSPLFGAMRKTHEMVEFQITQEYLGAANHLVYLAPLYKETLEGDTWADAVPHSTVARVTDGELRPSVMTAIAGVANIGEDANWCGHDFAQANWYAFGRLAWDPDLGAGDIATEWLRQTFCVDTAFVDALRERIMMPSREAAVDYMMPLGLHHIFAEGHHYGPEPWFDSAQRPDWRSTYYHRASADGIGFDRTTSGSNAVSQYFSPLRDIYNNLDTCPEELLLWFHHVSWDYSMRNGRTLWDEMCYRYDGGVNKVRCFQKTWDEMERFVDPERFAAVQYKLKIQARDAVWWKDACLLYFQTFSRRPIPYELERPVHDLDELKAIKLDLQNHN